MCGSHGMIDKHYVMYDDVLKVPLLISWPGKAASSRINKFVSNCLDLPATISDIAGLDLDPGHGKSLIPLVTGQEQARPRYITASSNGQQFGLYTQRSIRTEKWKYIWNLTDTDELYDLENDAGEKNNLINKADSEAVLSELRKLLWEELTRLEDPFVKSGWLKGQLLNNRKLTRKT
jgi:arylsulfatase A-like enzyme